ncbi:MAG: tRNA (adenosine(37)-N6)-dimethylallyltransferase MiaA [Bacteroidales bacterium]|nr:tRNA (adenosine(37)-N6)-dimethylallyltransferase MiaA [Bacteroidales bacterium]
MRINYKDKLLVVITGPTAVGKTETSIKIAEKLNTGIVSADARQFYKELKIGTAAPTSTELARAKHYLTGHLSIFDYYNVSLFEQQALAALDEIFAESDFAILTGGSGLYIDTLCRGIDAMPDAGPDVRNKVKNIYRDEGLEGLQTLLQQADPEYFKEVDKSNPNRMMRGLEVFLSTGEKFSDLRKKTSIQRPFRIKKIILNRPRPELNERIQTRTRLMVQEGLIEEAIRFFPVRHLNAMNTVGYKELFAWMQNQYSLITAIEKISTNTRRYAKRQLTWFKKYDDAMWFLPDEQNRILSYIQKERD